MRQAPVTIQIAPHSSFRDPFLDGGSCCFCSGSRPHGNLDTDPGTGTLRPRPRMPQYELIDFVAVLLGYMLSGEPTLLAFYERLTLVQQTPLWPWMPRNRLPHRSTLSRYLSALDQASVEALRTLFQKDVLARKPFPSPGGLFDRTDQQWIVIDVDGTRQAARQRALPQTDRLPTPHRR